MNAVTPKEGILKAHKLASTAEALRLVEIYRRWVGKVPSERDYTGFESIFYTAFRDVSQEDGRFIYDLGTRCLEKARAFFSNPDIMIESIFLTCLGEGGFHPLHSDNERESAPGCWVPNHTPQRSHSSLVYLNWAFEGGKIWFPNYGINISPEPGLFVAFPSHREYAHYVDPVRRGTRYAMPVWYTLLPEHEMKT